MPELDAQHRTQLAETLDRSEHALARGAYDATCGTCRAGRKEAEDLADALAPLVAEWLAGAWDEGYLLALRDVENIAADMNADNPYRDNPSKDGEDG